MNQLAKKEETAVVTAETSMMEVISRVASDPNADVDKLERMMALYERMEAKKAETAFNAALVSAQQEMHPVAADATNPQTRSKYATYAKLDSKLRPVYTKRGFSLSFDTGDAQEGYVRVICHVAHATGHSRSYHIDMPADGKGAKGGDVMTKTHAAGAAMSYGMRYLLKMIFNVAVGEDDADGNMPIERITAEQVANLEALITEVGADKHKFLRFIGASKLEDIQAAAYSNAVKMLERKRHAS